MPSAALLTPRTPGAIAIIQIDGDIDAALATLGIDPLAIGDRKLTDLCGIDRGIAVRWSETCVQLLPHGGPSVVSGLLKAIESKGISVSADRSSFPEAEDETEALTMRAISLAASPAAVSRLLKQPDAWRSWDGQSPTVDDVDRHTVILNRLIDPPTVVAIGRPNIGKSALLNAMTGERVALVADQIGVTRDHVGVSLRLGSGAEAVEIRWIDTPGLDETVPSDALDDAITESAISAIRAADCVVLCADACSGIVDRESLPIEAGTPIHRIGLRCDLGPCGGCDVETSAVTGQGLADLARFLKDSLFPAESIDWPGPWRFDRDLKPGR